jgi:hypothetical protein
MRIVALFVSAVVLLSACATPPPAVKPVAPVAAPKAPVSPAPTEFQVSAEKKQASLVEIRALVDKLNAIIAKKSFTEWRPYLDEDYIHVYSDPVRLKAYSTSSPFLKQMKISLKTLEDYFKFVVVPSRADVTVEDITFVDENRVNVWTVVDNERVLLYLLKLYGKEWKISSW